MGPFAEATIVENSQPHLAVVQEVLTEMRQWGLNPKGRCRKVVEESYEVLFQGEVEGIVGMNHLPGVVWRRQVSDVPVPLIKQKARHQ